MYWIPKGERFMIWFFVGILAVVLSVAVLQFVIGFWQGGCALLVVLGCLGHIIATGLDESVETAKDVKRYREWKSQE
jgi:hypothetical protein